MQAELAGALILSLFCGAQEPDVRPAAQAAQPAQEQSEALASLLERTRSTLDTIRKERTAHPEESRAEVTRAVKSLAEADARVLADPRAQNLLGELGKLAFELGELHAAHDAWKIVHTERERALDRDDPRLQYARATLAVVLGELGDLPTAQRLEEQVLESYERKPPPDENELQRARMSLAATLGRQLRYAEARPLVEMALARWRETLPAGHADLLRARQYLLNILTGLGQHQEAGILAEELLAAALEALPENDMTLWSVCSSVATTREQAGDAQGALELRRKALAIAESRLPPEHPSVQLSRVDLARSLRNQGELEEARAIYVDVLALRERTLPPDALPIQAVRLDLASTLFFQGDLSGAQALAEPAVEALERALAPEDPAIGNALGLLSQILLRQGDVLGARLVGERGLASLERAYPDDHPLLQDARQILAAAMNEMGDLQSARVLQEKVLEARERTLPPDHYNLQVARQELAGTLDGLGDASSAKELLEKALGAHTRALPEGHPEITGMRLNLALVLIELGQIESAKAALEQVASEFERVLPETHPNRIAARSALAHACLLLGEPERARELTNQVIAAMQGRFPADNSHLQRARRNMCWILEACGDQPARALELTRVADGLEARLIGMLGLAPRAALEAARHATVDLDLLLSACQRDGPASPLARRTFELAERLRAVSLAPALPAGLRASDPELDALAVQALDLRRRVDDLVTGTAAQGEDESSAPDAIATAVRERDRIEASIRRALVERGASALEFDSQKLASALPPGSAAIAWRRWTRMSLTRAEKRFEEHTEERLLAHVLRKDGALVSVDLGPIEDVRTAVAAWRTAVGEPIGRGLAAASTSGAGARAEDEAGDRLRRLVLDRALEACAGARVLVVCPDDALHLVPLEALPLPAAEVPTSEARTLVGERLDIRRETSLSRLLSQSERPSIEPALFAIGDVDFDAEGTAPTAAPTGLPTESRTGSAAVAWPPLPGTRAEVEHIAATFQDILGIEPRVLRGAEATRQALIEGAPHARFLHIATHGWFAEPFRAPAQDSAPPGRLRMDREKTVKELAPMTLCGLALAGANRGSDALGRVRGAVTAEELAGLDLSRCELAVLSACETNVGVMHAGQGIQSLQTALHSAGVRTAITSAWRVDDDATRELFEDFYTRLWANHESKSAALWHAKLSLRASGRPTRDWAAWVLTGDPR